MYTRQAVESEFPAADGSRRPERRAKRTPHMMEIIERLESEIVVGRRVMGKVMLDENEVLSLLDQLREAVPSELDQARRVITKREEIVRDAQEEAEKILATARERAEYLISDRGLTAEARYRSEDVLRQARESQRATNSEIESYARRLLEDVEEAIERSRAAIEQAKSSLSEQT